MSDGFDTHELDDFARDLLELSQEKLPKETSKFIKKNANQLKTATKRKAKEVGIQELTGSKKKDRKYEYFINFRTGKVYNYNGGLSCRAYNSSPHAHLLEYGHRMVGHGKKKDERADLTAKYKGKGGEMIESGFVPGLHPFEKAYQDYKEKYVDNCEKFIDEMLKEKGL